MEACLLQPIRETCQVFYFEFDLCFHGLHTL
jgi:hypothetical protein